MKRNEAFQKSLLQLYGSAPDDCRQRVHTLCAHLEEEKQVKRITTAALVLALVLLLAGGALAAHQMGTFDFLFPDKTIPDQVEQARQSGFTQTGEAYADVDFKVIDAVSDGIYAYMALEAKVKDPANIIYSNYDHRAQEKPDPNIKTFTFLQDWMLGPDLVLMGTNFKAVDDQTVLLHLAIDINGKQANEPIEVILTPQVYQITGANQEQTFQEKHDIRVTILPSAMAQQHYTLAAPVYAKEIGAEIIATHLIQTPLATYLDIDIQPTYANDDELEAWDHTYGSLWFQAFDANGAPLALLTGGEKGGDDGAEPYVSKTIQVFENGTLPLPKLLLSPYIPGSENDFTPIELTFITD